MKKKFSLSIFIPGLLIILMLAFYVLTIKGVPGNPVPGDIKNNLDQSSKPLELSPERGRFILTMSLVEDRSFAISEKLAEAAFPDVGYLGNKYYILFAPGISLMAAPLYALGHLFNLSQVGAFFLSSIFAVLNAVFIYLIARRILRLHVWAGLFSALVFNFASNSWAYAVTLYQHQATTFFILSAFYCAWKFRQETKYSVLYALWVWTAYGLAISIDYPNVLFLAPVMVYLGLSAFKITLDKTRVLLFFRPALIFTSVTFIILIALHAYYNYSQFGSPTRLSGSLPSVQRLKSTTVQNTSANETITNQGGHDKNVTLFFHEDNLPNGLDVLTVSSDRGLFLYFPIFILGILGLGIYIWRFRTMENSILFTTAVCVFFLYSSWGDPWGGWAFGPRYLIPALAILSLYVGGLLDLFRHFYLRLLTLILFAYSAGISLIGVLTTNAVPPKSEAVLLHSRYNFLHNWLFFNDSHSSSYIYNTFVHRQFTLFYYALPMYIILLTLALVFLFVLPRFEKPKS